MNSLLVAGLNDPDSPYWLHLTQFTRVSTFISKTAKLEE